MKKVIIIILVIYLLYFPSILQGKTQVLKGKAQTAYRSAKLNISLQLYEKALHNFLDVLAYAPYHVESIYNVGDIYFRLAEDGDSDEAIEMYAIAHIYLERTLNTIQNIEGWQTFEGFESIKSDSELTINTICGRIFDMGKERYDNEDYDIAEDTFQRLLALAPDRADAKLMMAQIANLRGNTEEANEYYTQIIENAPESSQISPGLYYKINQDYENAIHFYTMSIKTEPSNINEYFSLAEIYLLINNFEEALKTYEVALEIEPDNIELLANAAQVATDLNNWELVKRLAIKWHQIDPTDKEPLLLIILAAQNLNEPNTVSTYTRILDRLK